jgi:hypothetical protein
MSKFGSVDPVEFRNQNYRSKRTDNSTKFAFAVISEFMKNRGKQNVDLVSLSTEELIKHYSAGFLRKCKSQNMEKCTRKIRC